jgi:sortase A
VGGELLVTLGVVVLLFAVWQLWWTDVLASRNYDAARDELQSEWGITDPATGVPREVTPEYGKPFGLMYIPAMGERAWKVPIIQGTDLELLHDGVGHHVRSALPGQVGNMAIAGHRTTYGAPFADIDQMHPGDQVIVETKYGWYVYQVDRSTIIEFWEGWVLDPVPGKPRGTEPKQAMITIYGCHPKFSAAQRFVWFGHLVDEYTKTAGTPPAIQAHGRG